MADIIKSYNDVARRNVDMNDGTYAEVISAVSNNITTKFRDAFESYSPNNGTWAEVKDSGDLIYVDGNAAAASYLVISKDPLSAGTETSITSVCKMSFPIEASFGASLSQRTLGQEFSFEIVDSGIPLDNLPDLEIFSISQSTTTLTVETTSTHGLSVGKSIGIRDCSNLLANYPALVVSTVSSPTQFTATAGPGGTIPSQTITNPAGKKGFVYFRERMGRAKNGISHIFENATATNASLYIRSEAGDALPSGTIAGSHAVTVGTTASVQLVNVSYQYAFTPTTEFRIFAQSDRTQWVDGAVDAVTQTTSRLLRTQVCPDPSVTYNFRIRCTNNKSLTVPNAQIVSAVKSGTTTATIVTDRPHGLVAGDPVVIYGIRNQSAAFFPSLTSATPVDSVIDATTFTIVIGTGTSGTSYGGYVAKVQGGNLMSGLGAITVAAQSVTLSTLSDGTRQLVISGSSSWSGVVIGDLVNAVGVRDVLTGASLNVDGAWKVANVVTTTLTLVLPYYESMTLPADFVSTNCGGGIIKRTDLRVSFVRIFDYERERVELLARPAGDVSASVPVVLQNSSITSLVEGTQNFNSTVIPNPVLMSVYGVSALPVSVSSGRQQRALGTLPGALVTRPYSIPENDWLYAAASGGIVNTTTAVTIKAAAGANVRNYITNIQIMSDALTNATEVAVRDGAAGTVLWRTKIPTSGISWSEFNFSCPIRGSANTLLEVVTLTASGTGAVYFNAQGFAAP
jgi:hypothetical protein